MRIGVDVRMLKSSGIGKVIENILIRMIPMKPEWDFYLIGKSEEIKEVLFADKDNLVEVKYRIFCREYEYTIHKENKRENRLCIKDCSW